MKVVLVLLLIVVGVVGYLFFGPASSSPAPAPAAPVAVQPGQAVPPAVDGEPVANATQPQTATPNGEVAPRAVSANSFAQDVTDVGGYVMWHTQVMVKKRSATKLDDLNKKHTDQLNDAMDK